MGSLGGSGWQALASAGTEMAAGGGVTSSYRRTVLISVGAWVRSLRRYRSRRPHR
jgi:hypothetical protein